MCGIFGYANFNHNVTVREILNKLINGLKKMEYRGYDSAGLCIDRVPDPQRQDPEDPKTHKDVVEDKDDPNHVFVRSCGNISQLAEKVFSAETQSNLPPLDEVRAHSVSIAHTRWATHGEVTERNCHPQRSNGGEFVVVHNGIMTNYTSVKEMLVKEGYHFHSQTDTEVICVLAEYLYLKNTTLTFPELMTKLTDFVEGAYALLITSVYFPGEIAAARKGSPLVLGVRHKKGGGDWQESRAFQMIGDDEAVEVFFASDCLAFVEYTTNAVYLDDDDIVHYKKGRVSFYSSREVGEMSAYRPFEQLEITLESLTKGNYEHYMLKEICEQSDSVVGSMRGRLDFARQMVSLGGFTPQNVRSVLHSQRLILISCGTSLHSCYAVRPVLDELLPVSVMIENACDFGDRLPRIYRNDTCLFVSQSGETADTLLALKHCRDSGALCVGVTNVVGSSVSRLTDFGCHLNAGQEVGVASTKAYTSQIVVLLLIALMLSKDSVAAQERRREIIKGLSELSATLSHVLAQVSGVVNEIAAELNHCHSLLILGRGNDYATAMEGALKIKELTYMHTEGINSGELKHGPLALIDETIPVIALCSNDKHFLKSKTAIQQVHARKGRVIVITNVEGDKELEEAATRVLVVPPTVDCLQCIVNIIPLQLISYHLALLKGNNVDCPRNLAKSVTTQ